MRGLTQAGARLGEAALPLLANEAYREILTVARFERDYKIMAQAHNEIHQFMKKAMQQENQVFPPSPHPASFACHLRSLVELPRPGGISLSDAVIGRRVGPIVSGPWNGLCALAGDVSTGLVDRESAGPVLGRAHVEGRVESDAA